MKKYLLSAYGPDIKSNQDFARIINVPTAENLAALLDGKKTSNQTDFDKIPQVPAFHVPQGSP